MKSLIIFGLLLVGVFLNVVPPLQVAAAEAGEEGNECLGWYNNNRADFLAREGVLPGTFLTCNQDELDKLNQHEGKAITQEQVDDDDDNNERLDKKYCAGSGFWDGHRCVIDDPVEKAAYEDAVCDDPKDTDKYSKICGGSYAVEEKPKQSKEDSNRQQSDDNNDNAADDKKEKNKKGVEGNKIIAAASEKYKELVKDIDDDEDDGKDHDDDKKQKDSHDDNDDDNKDDNDDDSDSDNSKSD